MKIVVAPNAFKESLTSPEAAEWIEKGLRKALPEARVVSVPMADGGVRTVQAMVAATGGKIFLKKVTGPLGAPVVAEFGILGDGATAVIEMSAASGLKLVPPPRRDPMKTTTCGTGQLIEAALKKGVKKIIVGIGDSATVDGGCGMAQALGYRLLDRAGKEIGFGGGKLANLHRIDPSNKNPLIGKVSVQAACDVNNPLTGQRGAARVYGPQKGATKKMVKELDKNLARFARIVKRDLGVDVEKVPGGGAAGGLGAGLMAFLGASLRMGVEIVAEACGLREKIRGADLVITGEGRLDGQTILGKTPIGVARIAAKEGVPVIAINGSLTEDAYRLNRHGIDAIFCTLTGTVTLDEALKKAGPALMKTAEQVLRLFLIGRKK